MVYALQVILFEECCDSLVFYGFQLQQAVALGGLESGGTDERTSEGGIVRKILKILKILKVGLLEKY